MQSLPEGRFDLRVRLHRVSFPNVQLHFLGYVTKSFRISHLGNKIAVRNTHVCTAFSENVGFRVADDILLSDKFLIECLLSCLSLSRLV